MKNEQSSFQCKREKKIGFIVLTEKIDDVINNIPEFALFCKECFENYINEFTIKNQFLVNFKIPQKFEIPEKEIIVKTNFEENITIISFSSELLK